MLFRSPCSVLTTSIVIALTAAQRMSAPGSAKPLCPLTVKPACRPFLTKNAACIIALERDAHDLQLGIRLSVADMLLLVLLGFITDNVDFFALAVLDDVRGHSTGHRRRADGKAGRGGDRKNLLEGVGVALDRKSTRLNSSHKVQSRMPSSA